MKFQIKIFLMVYLNKITLLYFVHIVQYVNIFFLLGYQMIITYTYIELATCTI